ncbi:MAG: hypothetical protein KA715_03590 [Xanthomonadaceae bacterium]|nr:hypothetical protein [Xanthomonadaceae bacterium]
MKNERIRFYSFFVLSVLMSTHAFAEMRQKKKELKAQSRGARLEKRNIKKEARLEKKVQRNIAMGWQKNEDESYFKSKQRKNGNIKVKTFSRDESGFFVKNKKVQNSSGVTIREKTKERNKDGTKYVERKKQVLDANGAHAGYNKRSKSKDALGNKEVLASRAMKDATGRLVGSREMSKYKNANGLKDVSRERAIRDRQGNIIGTKISSQRKEINGIKVRTGTYNSGVGVYSKEVGSYKRSKVKGGTWSKRDGEMRNSTLFRRSVTRNER